MKKVVIWIIIAAFLLSGLSVAVFSETLPKGPSIKVAPPAPEFTDAERQAELARRRAAVAAKMADNSILVLWAAEPRNYAGDVDFFFRQENNLFYLTNLKQANSAFVMTKSGGAVSEYLFLPKRNPQFETWEGRMYSNEDATRISGITQIIDAAEKTAFFTALGNKQQFAAKSGVGIDTARDTIYLLMPNNERDSNGIAEYSRERDFAAKLTGFKVENARPILDELRLIKSPYEIKIMQHAIDITNEAHMRAMAMVGRADWEYEVQAEVEYTFRRRNADYWGYPSIVGCGPNATTLHYSESQSPIVKGQLLLMDVGAEYGHYTADITRTFPVNGKFTKEQADIYQIVYNAQEAVAKLTKPGAQFADLSAAARKVIEDGLFDLGLITKKDGRQVGIWYMHGLGHWLGMNVHDVGRYGTPLAPGMIFTNEPGIYIREDALNYLPDTPEYREFRQKVGPVFERYKNIGVRIEDDMLVTENGVEWMTKALPREMKAIESFMASASKEFKFNGMNRPRPDDLFFRSIGGGMPGDVFATNAYPTGSTQRYGFVRIGEMGHGSHGE
ncbi:MAG: aminopeptidase P family protein [Pyrinomonadaceae bacterium]|nr:aminopeptidase P family protein [Pyrinomonadaceae bacterium]